MQAFVFHHCLNPHNGLKSHNLNSCKLQVWLGGLQGVCILVQSEAKVLVLETDIVAGPLLYLLQLPTCTGPNIK